MIEENINIINEVNERKNKIITPSNNDQNYNNENTIKNNLNNNNSKNNTIIKEKYINEFLQLKKDVPDLIKYFSKDFILVTLSKNNGDLQKTSDYLFNYIISHQNKKND